MHLAFGVWVMLDDDLAWWVSWRMVISWRPWRSGSSPIQESHFQCYQFFRMPIATSSESGSLYCTFPLQLFEDRLKLGLFEFSATCNHRSRQIAARSLQFPQDSVLLVLSEMFQRSPSFGNMLRSFFMINYRMNHTESMIGPIIALISLPIPGSTDPQRLWSIDRIREFPDPLCKNRNLWFCIWIFFLHWK